MPSSPAAPNLVGGDILLRAPSREDARSRQDHGWHGSIERGYGSERATGPMSAEESEAWAEEVLDRATDSFWAVDVEGRLAGHAFLHHVDHTDRRARFAIGLLAPELMGLGTGTAATRLVLRHAFGTLGLHRVDLRVLAFNEAAIACYRRCGFVDEGRERETCWLEGRWHDDLVMGVLADEFRAVDEALPRLG